MKNYNKIISILKAYESDFEPEHLEDLISDLEDIKDGSELLKCLIEELKNADQIESFEEVEAILEKLI